MSIHMKTAASLLALACVASPIADAQVFTLPSEGSWKAFAGRSDDGTPMCGISSKGPSKYLALKYFQGSGALTVQLSANDWRIRDGQKQRVEVKIDNGGPWTASATGIHFGDGDAGLEFKISADQVDEFMNEFRTGDEISVSFPGSPVSDWRGTLNGSDTVSFSFLQCLRAMNS